MPELDQERLANANAVRQALALEDELTASQARSFVRCIQTSWRVPAIRWSDDDSKLQLADARRLLQAAAIYRSIQGAQSGEAAQCYRRAAELLEWLSRSGERVGRRNMGQLLAAGAFQLGGLPAMASSLLSQVRVDDAGSHIYSSFFQADFDEVLRATNAFWKAHPELTEREASSRILSEDFHEKVSWYITVEIVRSLGLVADCVRRGDETRLALATSKLEALDGMVARSLSDDVSMLVTLLSAAAKQYVDFSIYKPILRLADIRPERIAKLKSIARGQFSRRRGILWLSQRQGLEKLITQSSFALCTPTGSGKTLVANLALVKELLLRNDTQTAPLALYLVPSRALANEVERKLQSELGRDFIITGLYGGTDWGITDYWLTADKPTVLVATVEKADALMRYVGPILLGRLRLLILDEAHQVVPDDNNRSIEAFAEHTSRSSRLESFVSRLFALAPDLVRIALTAVAGGAALPVARWFEGTNDAQAVGTNYRSTRQIIGKLSTSATAAPVIELDIRNGRPLYVRDRDEPVYIRLSIPAMPTLPARMRGSLYRFNEVSILWTALHLGDETRRILISVLERPEATMSWYREALELDTWSTVPAFSLPENAADRTLFDDTVACCIDYCGQDSNELALLRRGIATNHGQMPQRLRRLMVDLIDRKICTITVATATLTEGVNLPFDLVFVASLTRTGFEPGRTQPISIPMSTAEFRNLAGRSGRPGSSNGLEGVALAAVPSGISTTAPGQLRAQRRQLRAMNAEYADLVSRLLTEEVLAAGVRSPLAMLLAFIAQQAIATFNFDEAGFLKWLETVSPPELSPNAGQAEATDISRFADSLDELDSVLLCALEEYARIRTTALTRPEIEDFLASLWRNTFTMVANSQEQWLERSFIRRGVGIVDNVYPDAAERRKIYLSGFAPVVAKRFASVAPILKEILTQATNYGSANSEERLTFFISLMEIIANDRGYGFRVRPTAKDASLFEDRVALLRWWMQVGAESTPDPSDLRDWQRFVFDNLEFRLGVTVGAVVAQAWSDGAGDPPTQPTLEEWKDTTGLPWFGFWCRELLRWGTVEPFVAFVLAQGLAGTRERAASRLPEFEQWLQEHLEEITPEDKIDPQLLLQWQRSLPVDTADVTDPVLSIVEMTGSTGKHAIYNVTPIVRDGMVSWIDPSGYEIGRSAGGVAEGESSHQCDYEIHTEAGMQSVRRTYFGKPQ